MGKPENDLEQVRWREPAADGSCLACSRAAAWAAPPCFLRAVAAAPSCGHRTDVHTQLKTAESGRRQPSRTGPCPKHSTRGPPSGTAEPPNAATQPHHSQYLVAAVGGAPVSCTGGGSIADRGGGGGGSLAAFCCCCCWPLLPFGAGPGAAAAALEVATGRWGPLGRRRLGQRSGRAGRGRQLLLLGAAHLPCPPRPSGGRRAAAWAPSILGRPFGLVWRLRRAPRRSGVVGTTRSPETIDQTSPPPMQPRQGAAPTSCHLAACSCTSLQLL